MQTPPMGPMLHYSITNHTALSHLQISAHCTSLHNCHLTRSSNTTPNSTGHDQHITLMATKHSICSSWVRWYVLQWHASFLTSSGISSAILFKTMGIASILTARSTCTRTASRLITASQTQQRIHLHIHLHIHLQRPRGAFPQHMHLHIHRQRPRCTWCTWCTCAPTATPTHTRDQGAHVPTHTPT